MRSAPKWPFPFIFKVVPLSIPLGNLTDYVSLTISIPDPEHLVQGEVLIAPSPLQLWHSILITIMPCLIWMWPAPWHAWHFCGFVPGLDLEPLQVPQVHFLFSSKSFIDNIILLLFRSLLQRSLDLLSRPYLHEKFLLLHFLPLWTSVKKLTRNHPYSDDDLLLLLLFSLETLRWIDWICPPH